MATKKKRAKRRPSHKQRKPAPANRRAVASAKRKAPALSARRASVRAQPLIAVRDVISASRWYRSLLAGDNLEQGSDHDDVYDRIYCDGRLVLQLHSWDDEQHPNLTGASAHVPGHGVLIWFEVSDFDAAVERARGLEAEILEEPHVNPSAQHREIWLRDSDGYMVVLASPDGEAT